MQLLLCYSCIRGSIQQKRGIQRSVFRVEGKQIFGIRALGLHWVRLLAELMTMWA